MPGIAFDFRRHEDVFALRPEPIHQRKRTARDARDDRNRVSFLQGGRILLEIADVLLVDVDVHEIPQAAVVRIEMTSKLVEAVHEVSEGLFDAFGLDLHRIVVRRVLTESRRNDDPDRSHGRACSMTVLYLRFVPRVLRIRITGETTAPRLPGKVQRSTISSGRNDPVASSNCQAVTSLGCPLTTLAITYDNQLAARDRSYSEGAAGWARWLWEIPMRSRVFFRTSSSTRGRSRGSTADRRGRVSLATFRGRRGSLTRRGALRMPVRK